MLSKNEIFVIADIDNKFHNKNSLTILRDPAHIIRADRASQVQGAIRQINDLSQEGFYLAGYVSYEAGRILQGFNQPESSVDELPLVWFGAFREEKEFQNECPEKIAPDQFYLSQIIPRITREEYSEGFNIIKNLISSGIVYQINYTFPSDFKFYGDIMSLFFSLRKNQNSAYNFLISLDGKQILSLSPELFFFKDGQKIITKPMKGTLGKNQDKDTDKIALDKLLKDEKNRAENAMITDILRNDLGKICRGGSIIVDKFYEIEEYPTLYQLTSTVSGRLNDNIDLCKIFEALFPSASITGAPKLEAMQRIREIEKNARSVYTGSIGLIRPGGEALFNVAIRTLEISGNRVKIGLGSGIVYDSEMDSEFREALLKSRFLDTAGSDFYLFETILLTNGKYRLLNYHIQRLAESAIDMLFSFSEDRVRSYLDDLAKKLPQNGTFRIRLSVFPDGRIEHTNAPFDKSKMGYKILMDKYIVNSENSLLRHKSSRRKLFDETLQIVQSMGFNDALFINENGEITECCVHNIMVKKSGKWYTPALDCGLLPGTFRKYLLDKKFLTEAILRLEDLKSADQVAVMNSLRGINRAEITFK